MERVIQWRRHEQRRPQSWPLIMRGLSIVSTTETVTREHERDEVKYTAPPVLDQPPNVIMNGQISFARCARRRVSRTRCSPRPRVDRCVRPLTSTGTLVTYNERAKYAQPKLNVASHAVSSDPILHRVKVISVYRIFFPIKAGSSEKVTTFPQTKEESSRQPVGLLRSRLPQSHA